MLYTLLIQGEEARWETFKRAEQEAQRRAGLRDDAAGGRRLRRVSLRPTDWILPPSRRDHKRASGDAPVDLPMVGEGVRVVVGIRAKLRRMK